MATKVKKTVTPPRVRAEPIGADARGKVRVYCDIGKPEAIELAVLAARRGLTRKALLELLIMEATRQKQGV